MVRTQHEPWDTVVVGGGISGLTTAFWLSLAGRSVALLEAAERVGGSIRTLVRDGWIFELGPNTVLESRAEVSDLLRDAGLNPQKVEAGGGGRKRYLWKGGALQALPASPPAFLRSTVFSWSAKLRLLKEPFIGPAAEGVEESVADFVRRRLGQTFLDDAVGPFVSGVYAGDPEQLSVRWAVPRIHDLETHHGSLIRGALALRKERGGAVDTGPRGAMISLAEGLEGIPRRLAACIEEHGGAVLTSRPALKVERRDDLFHVHTEGSPLEARRLVTSVPADVTARLLAPLTAERSLQLTEIPYAPVAVVALGAAREQIEHPLDGFGFLVPRKEDLTLLGCLFPSSLFPGRAPQGHVALSAFLGGATSPEIVYWDDERLVSVVRQDLERAIGLRGEPKLLEVRRWPRAIPQYNLGHGRFVELAGHLEAEHPGLHIGGNFLRGISVPDCIKNATTLARSILSWEPETAEAAEPLGAAV